MLDELIQIISARMMYSLESGLQTNHMILKFVTMLTTWYGLEMKDYLPLKELLRILLSKDLALHSRLWTLIPVLLISSVNQVLLNIQLLILVMEHTLLQSMIQRT